MHFIISSTACFSPDFSQQVFESAMQFNAIRLPRVRATRRVAPTVARTFAEFDFMLRRFFGMIIKVIGRGHFAARRWGRGLNERSEQ
jgi:hypothetical protein